MNKVSRCKVLLKICVLGFLLSGLSSCATELVAPYDEGLVTGTEAFYKKAAGIIDEGIRVSPRTDQERERIQDPNNHDAHFSRFEPKYSDLLVDSEALVLRAITGSYEIDKVGQKLQEKIDEFIEKQIPSVCQGLSEEFGKTSLTTKNYIDLMCIVSKWKERHENKELTRNTLILKRANWEGRKKTIFNAILAIQKAESKKKKDQ
ncbi:MAG: hypothetical protein ISS70_09515 [Phycisphaerae bacterium]|nr:hypothetical protein [Phycisphaerae bacterium]